MAGVNGAALGAIATGSLFAYAALRGKSVLSTVQSLVAGKPPSAAAAANPIAGGSTAAAAGAAAVTGGSAQQLLQAAAARHGWGSGPQWEALSNVEMAEAGFSATAQNPASGALGLGQALGHGNANTAGTLGNEYGGFGLSDAQARAANSGDAGWQAVWMCNYIAATYGDPESAWAHEQSNGWY